MNIAKTRAHFVRERDQTNGPSCIDDAQQLVSTKMGMLDHQGDPRFAAPEDMAKACKELRTKLSRGEALDALADEVDAILDDVDDDVSTATDDLTEEKTDEDLAREATGKAGIDFDELNQRFWSNGEQLELADYEQLEAA